MNQPESLFSQHHHDVLAKVIGSSATFEIFLQRIIKKLKADNPKFDEKLFKNTIKETYVTE